jgi:hypothetical protein
MPRTKAALIESKSKVNSRASTKSDMPKAKATKKTTRGDGGKKKKGLFGSLMYKFLSLIPD